jgi:hypothetical protein
LRLSLVDAGSLISPQKGLFARGDLEINSLMSSGVGDPNCLGGDGFWWGGNLKLVGPGLLLSKAQKHTGYGLGYLK